MRDLNLCILCKYSYFQPLELKFKFSSLVKNINVEVTQRKKRITSLYETKRSKHNTSLYHLPLSF